uniref:trypsin n=1 Tax=Electrophorus electricus TaxID=8005 RepID=A0AAY5ECS3_ELEEL
MGGWPWQAALRLRGFQADGRLVCGATLISSCWVLTSAHCFKSTVLYKVRVGDYHALVPEEGEQEYAVDRIVMHPHYRPHGNDYDLALVRLLVGGGADGERVPRAKANCYITGWGDTVHPDLQASITILSKRHCKHRYADQFTGRMLCAGSAFGDRRVDSCRGDSGGPLMCKRENGTWVVYGVTSWGHSCRQQNSPGVYTKVSAFVPWIKKVTGQ